MASVSSQYSSSFPYPYPLFRTIIGNKLKGNFLSMTTKSGFRYEGILDQIHDPEDEKSVLCMRNVRSFGTEGRRKDEPQIPATDSVYSFILFRGSEIKDLLFKVNPSEQSRHEIQRDEDTNQLIHYRPNNGSSLSGYTPTLSSEQLPATQPLQTPISFGTLAELQGTTLSSEQLPATQPLRPPFSFGNLAELQGTTLSSEQLPATQPLQTPFSFGTLAELQGTQLVPTADPLHPMHQTVSPQSLDYLASNPSHLNPSPFVGAQFFPQNSNPNALQAFGNDVYQSQFNYPIWPIPYPLAAMAPDPASVIPYQLAAMAPNPASVIPYQLAAMAPNPASVIPYQLAAMAPNPASVIPGQFLTSPESFSGVQTLPQSRQYPYDSRDMSQGRYGATNLTSVDEPSQNLANTNQTPWLPPPVSVQQPVYNRDEFFDTQLATQFPEHMRQDPEAFGDSFQRGPQPLPGQGEYLVAQTNYRDGDNSNNYENSGGSGRGHGRNTHF